MKLIIISHITYILKFRRFYQSPSPKSDLFEHLHVCKKHLNTPFILNIQHFSVIFILLLLLPANTSLSILVFQGAKAKAILTATFSRKVFAKEHKFHFSGICRVTLQISGKVIGQKN